MKRTVFRARAPPHLWTFPIVRSHAEQALRKSLARVSAKMKQHSVHWLYNTILTTAFSHLRSSAAALNTPVKFFETGSRRLRSYAFGSIILFVHVLTRPKW